MPRYVDIDGEIAFLQPGVHPPSNFNTKMAEFRATFSGGPSENGLQHWRLFETFVRRLVRQSDQASPIRLYEDQYDIFYSSLRGPAISWIEGHTFADINALKTAFLGRFSKTPTEQEDMVTLSSKKNNTQTLEAYADSLMEAGKRRQMPANYLKSIFINGLSQAMKLYVTGQNPADITAAVKAAQVFQSVAGFPEVTPPPTPIPKHSSSVTFDVKEDSNDSAIFLLCDKLDKFLSMQDKSTERKHNDRGRQRDRNYRQSTPSYSRSPRRSNSRDNRRSSSRTTSSRSTSRNRDFSNITCFNCKRRGHVYKNCRFPKEDSYASKRENAAFRAYLEDYDNTPSDSSKLMGEVKQLIKSAMEGKQNHQTSENSELFSVLSELKEVVHKSHEKPTSESSLQDGFHKLIEAMKDKGFLTGQM